MNNIGSRIASSLSSIASSASAAASTALSSLGAWATGVKGFMTSIGTSFMARFASTPQQAARKEQHAAVKATVGGTHLEDLAKAKEKNQDKLYSSAARALVGLCTGINGLRSSKLDAALAGKSKSFTEKERNLLNKIGAANLKPLLDTDDPDQEAIANTLKSFVIAGELSGVKI